MKRKDPVWVAGTMSGTSLDGVDAAMILTDGETISEFGPSAFRPYTVAEQAQLRACLGTWDAGAQICELIETAHAEVLSRLEGYELVGFHGQTLAHEPRGRGTYQAGDGAVLAEVLGVPVVWDFRSMDVEAGGEGAPLAPFFHHACARHIGAQAPLAFLNLGGVGNITWVDPGMMRPEQTGALLAFDTGPANAPVNDLVQRRSGRAFDENGALAARGNVAEGVLEQFLAHPYFFKMPPKSLDRDDFAHLESLVADLCEADAAATLTACAAAAVSASMEHCPTAPERLLVTGGGRHNATLMSMIAAGVDCPVEPVEAVGLDGNMLEAQAFGYLAMRVLCGRPTSCPATTGVAAAIGGGRISRPVAGQVRAPA